MAHAMLTQHSAECELAMQDPMDGSPAVLVQRYNITQQKELELQLSLQQEALQRSVPWHRCAKFL